MQNTNYAIIMAGGIGSRFWPWSRTNRPKQFLDIFGTGKTLIEQTFDRIEQICPAENILIVTNAMYRETIMELLPRMIPDNILCEPVMRNTAPCIAYGAYKIRKKAPKANLLVAAADHIILKEEKFKEVVLGGFEFASENNALITIGLKPHRPETGYGYIQRDGNESLMESPHFDFHKVKQFHEKPKFEKAQEYLKAGDYFWNSGMFIWSLDAVLNAFDKHLPFVNELFKSVYEDFYTDKEESVIADIYEKSEKVSIDVGVMEKADNVYVLCTDIGWSDIGTWGSLFEHSEFDEQQNALSGDNILVSDSSDNFVRIPKDKIAVIQGLTDYIVVDNGDALLICPKKNEQKIRDFVDIVKNRFGENFV